MYAVERLGNYITRGVYHVSGPFHPFGGAVDIIVVEQPDGSFKSSPWYVRFGKFQGVLKSREKVVNISVNGVEANFSMYLDQRGHAYFLREVEGEEGDYMLLQSSSNGETDLLSPREVRNLKSKSCNYDGNDVCLIDQIDTNIGKDDGRTNSCRERMLGLAYRQRDVNKDSPKGCAEENVMRRFSSLDRAEMAASLLEVKWTTDLATKRSKKRNATRSAASYTIVFEKNEQRQPDPAMQNSTETSKGAGSDSDVEQDSPSVLRLSSIDGVVLTTDLDEDVLKEEHVTISSMSMNVDGPGSPEVNCNGIANDAVTDFFVPGAQISDKNEPFSQKNPFEDQVSDKKNCIALPGSCISNQESRCDRVHSTSNDSLERSTVGMYGEKEQIHDTLNVASGPGGQIFDAEAFPATTEPLEFSNEGKQGNQHDENFKSETKCVETCGKGFTRVNSDVLNLDIDIPVISPECSSPVLGFARILDTVGGEMSKNAFDDSSSIILNEQVENGGGEKDINTNEPSLDNSESFHDDCRLKKASSVPVSHITDDNQFLFSDRDELKVNDSMKEVEKCENSNNEPCSFPGDQENQSPNRVNSTTSTPIEVPKAQSVPDLMSLSISNNLDADDPKNPLSRSLDSPSNSGKWKLDVNDVSSSVHVDSANGNQLEQELLSNGDALQNEAASPSVGNPSEPEASGGNWRLWPFSLKKSGSRNSTQPSLSGARSDAGTVSGESVSGKSVEKDKDNDAPNTRVFKKVARANAPTSEQLAELNLKEGSNSVTFTFSTSMLGKQQVEARIYRWKWNTRIVISDVDGTITKSDVLGQFMPLVGVDWSQMGVAHLFSDIKKNGYQLLFLSARAISQAYHTRRFLFNLKQDGKCLPDGPVVISPDGLFPSLFREVIRRCPHEFKIACLEDIKVLFPPDCSPFYAGFGNRDTDEISYLKVGIPRGKIFTINPKGEVSVNRRIDRKSYTSLHALVHDMFPPTLSSEQEDFNSWNFWKLPPPLVDT